MPLDYFSGDNRSNFERMLDGDPYIADEAEFVTRNLRAMNLVDKYYKAYISGSDQARSYLEELFAQFGKDAVIRPPFFVDYGMNISIGERTFINYNLTALDVISITIGQDCQIAPNVQLLTATHPIEPTPRRDKVESGIPIHIADNVWLGAGAIICPGASIGENSIIGAGSVVTRNIPENVVAVGNPARIIREIQNH